MIVIPALAYIYRDTSAWNHNADYTWLWAMKVRSAFTPGFAVGNAILATRNDDDFLQFDGAPNTFKPSVRVGAAVAASTNGTFLFTTGGGGPYYCALRRSGTNLEWYVGTTPGNVSLDATATAAIGARAAATKFFINGEVTGDNLNALQEIGRMRVYTEAYDLNRIRRELAAVNATTATNLWGDWPMSRPDDLADKSGNGRDLTAVGTPTQGERLGPMALVAIAGPRPVSSFM